LPHSSQPHAKFGFPIETGKRTPVNDYGLDNFKAFIWAVDSNYPFVTGDADAAGKRLQRSERGG
jgi:hypothetical protein